MSIQQSTQTKAVPQPSFTPVQTGLLQRKCACGRHTVAGGECAECRQKREGTLQRAAMSSASVSAVPSIVDEVLSSPGQPLGTGTRGFMEPRFDYDFSQVRIHTDSRAEESTQAVNALAYTVGQNIVFGAGQYAPKTLAGQRLIAHELTHVVQQSTMNGTHPYTIGPTSDVYEAEANESASSIVPTLDTGSPQSNTSSLSISHHVHSPTLQRVSFGDNGELSPGRKAIVGAAAQIAERLVKDTAGLSTFRRKWEAFWKGSGALITPKPSLEQYQNAVLGRVVHDMDSSTRPDVKQFVLDEKNLPLERQTAAVTQVGSMDTYIRRFAIDQGIDSVVSLLLHESLHGAGLPMGPAILYEPLFHGFEAEAGFPIMMGGADILDISQVERGDYEVDVTFTYNLHKIGTEDLPKSLEIQVVSSESGEVVNDQQPDGRWVPAHQSIPSKVGQGKWIWHARNPGWASHSVRIRDLTTPTLLGSRQFETDPRCVVGVSTIHCKDEDKPKPTPGGSSPSSTKKVDR
jgi:Domain of unknown function (DUF4157)